MVTFGAFEAVGDEYMAAGLSVNFGSPDGGIEDGRDADEAPAGGDVEALDVVWIFSTVALLLGSGVTAGNVAA